MLNISNFLEKIKKNINSEEEIKKTVSLIIKEISDVEIEVGQIEIKNYCIFLKTSPAATNKIFILKDKILQEISKSVKQKIIDIK